MTDFKYADFATWWDQQTDIDQDSEALARRIFKAARSTEQAARATPADHSSLTTEEIQLAVKVWRERRTRMPDIAVQEAFTDGLAAASALFKRRATPANHIGDAAEKVDAGSVPVAIGYLSAAGKEQLKHGPWVKLYRDANFPANLPVYAAPQPPQNAADHSVPVAIPEGWQLVPFDPTSAMTFVGQKHRYESAFSLGAIWQEMLDAAPQPPQSDAQSVRDAWISVDERLPEQHEWVLVSDGTWSEIGMHLDDEDLEPNKRWMDESAELIESNGIKITHWMPMPAPPQKPNEVKP